MEIIDNSEFNVESGFTETLKLHLTTTAKYARFIAITCFILIMLILAYAADLGLGEIQDKVFVTEDNPLAAIIFFVAALVWIIPNWKLLQFSIKFRKNISVMNMNEIEKAFAALKSVFIFYAITFALPILFLLLSLVIAVNKSTIEI